MIAEFNWQSWGTQLQKFLHKTHYCLTPLEYLCRQSTIFNLHVPWICWYTPYPSQTDWLIIFLQNVREWNIVLQECFTFLVAHIPCTVLRTVLQFRSRDPIVRSQWMLFLCYPSLPPTQVIFTFKSVWETNCHLVKSYHHHLCWSLHLTEDGVIPVKKKMKKWNYGVVVSG